MSIFDKAREKALKKLSEEDEEEVLDEGEDADETDEPTEGAEGEDTSSTNDGVGGPPSPTGEGEGATVDDSVDASVDTEAESGLTADVQDGVEGEGAEEEPIEDAPSTTDEDVGGPPPTASGGGAAEGGEVPSEDVMAVDGEVAEEPPMTEREQRFAAEFERLQGIADQAAAQVAELQAQLEEANARLEQVSATAEESIEAAAVNSGPPIFDHAAYRMMDEAAAEEYAAEHDRKMGEYYSRQAEERYQPYIAEHDKAVRAEGRRGAIGRLTESGELPGIEESEEDIFRILDEVPALQNDDSESAVAAAYLISVGLNAIKSTGEAGEKTAAEIVAEIEANPEVMKLLAEKQAAALSDNGNVPTFTRRASARSVPSSAPSTLNDASARARKRFGL